MKIAISYIPAETREADMILRFARSLLPRTKVRKSAAHPPKICVYLTWKNRVDPGFCPLRPSNYPGKDCGATKST